MLTPVQAWEVLKSAEPLCSAAAIARAVERIAADITRTHAADNPLVLCVMSGAVVFSGQLLPRLKFPLDFDYLHVTRYGNATSGGGIEWKVFPEAGIAGRVVLVVDDILDEGHTMVEIRKRVLAAGAQRFCCAVFADKDLGKPKPIAADFVGVRVPNRYVFGFGMDVKGAWRNLPEIYALKNGEG
ncbi:MAG: hypoxanthine-guanine phosphoribosyltransferase [Betaproteobacteria bacterium]|nr:hypoxanthine-guanine phosphoribosyltransferase [Betaproteobacteria bacterium]